MTCVVAVSDGACVVMGADSCGGSLEAGEIYTVEHPRKIFRQDPYLIGYTASFRVGQSLRRATLPEPSPGCDLYDHMVRRFLPALADVLQRDRNTMGDLWVKDDGVSSDARGCLIVAVDGRVFGVTADLSILETGEGIAIGCGRPYAYGALHALGSMGTPEARVRKALEASAAYSPGVRGPFHIEKMPSPRDPSGLVPLPKAVQQEGVKKYVHGG